MDLFIAHLGKWPALITRGSRIKRSSSGAYISRFAIAGKAALAILLLASEAHGGSITYNYVGNNFTFTNTPSLWSTANFISGSFTTASALGANLALQDITAAVSTFSFTDGSVNTITSASYFESYFLFSTDSLGNIMAWDVRAISGRPPTNVAVFTCNGSTAFNGCPNRPEDWSYQNNGPVNASNYSNPGRWTATFNAFQGGTIKAPVLLPTGPPVAGLNGTISGPGAQNYYSFYWAGGAFSASASVSGAAMGTSFLFSLGTAGSCNTSTADLNGSDSFSSTLAIANLSPGQYCIGIDPNSPLDPAFTLTFNSPVSGLATPEPSSRLLVWLGLGLTALLHRSRSRGWASERRSQAAAAHRT